MHFKPEQPYTGPISALIRLPIILNSFLHTTTENGTLKGVAVDLLGEITGKMGRRVTPDQVHLVPWTEGYQAALTGKTPCFSPPTG